MKYIHFELSNLIGLFERTMVQIYIYVCVQFFFVIYLKFVATDLFQ